MLRLFFKSDSLEFRKGRQLRLLTRWSVRVNNFGKSSVRSALHKLCLSYRIIGNWLQFEATSKIYTKCREYLMDATWESKVSCLPRESQNGDRISLVGSFFFLREPPGSS